MVEIKTLLRTVNTTPRRRKGCRMQPLLTCSKPHTNSGRARAETASTFSLTFLQQDHKNFRMSPPEHAHNATQQNACSGPWVLSLPCSSPPVSGQPEAHGRTPAVWHHHALRLPIWDFHGWQRLETPVTVCFFFLLFSRLLCSYLTQS